MVRFALLLLIYWSVKMHFQADLQFEPAYKLSDNLDLLRKTPYQNAVPIFEPTLQFKPA